MAEFGELLAERLGLGKVDVADGQVVALGQLGRERRRAALPTIRFHCALGRLVLGHPKAFGQRDLDLIFTRATFGLGRAGCP